MSLCLFCVIKVFCCAVFLSFVQVFSPFFSTYVREITRFWIYNNNNNKDSKCRLCQQFDETIDHIISACPILAKEQYIRRHDRVCAQLYFNICKETGVQLDKNTGMNMCHNRQGKARQPYCGTNNYKLTELSPKTNQTL